MGEKTLKEKALEAFIEMFKSSVIIQGAMTGMLFLTICVMLLLDRDIGTEFWALTTLTAGYWFGAKNNFTVQRIAKSQSESVNKLCQQVTALLDRERGGTT